MKRGWKIVLILSLLANLGIVYVAYKALDYRDHVNFYLHKYIDAVNEMARRDVFGETNLFLQSDTTISNRIVFFGTQVIAHWDVQKNFPGYDAVNRGVEGQRVAGLLLRFYPDVVALSPKYVVIQISSYNFRPQNSSESIWEYTRELYAMARCEGIIPIAATVLTPTVEILDIDDEIISSDYRIKDTIAVFNRFLKDYCRKNNILVADFDSILDGPDGFMREEYSETEIIPNEAGYRLLSETLKSNIFGPQAPE